MCVRYMCLGDTLLANSIFFFSLHACGTCRTRGTENVRESCVIYILLVINMNKQGQCQTPERAHCLIHLGTALCACLYRCVYVFDFEGICVFVQQDVKQEKYTTPAEGTKRQKVEGGARRGKKGHENKVIMKPCQGGEVYSHSGSIVMTLERWRGAILWGSLISSIRF